MQLRVGKHARALLVALVASAALSFVGCPEPREPLPAELEPALASISGEALEQHMRRLADDAMNGRGTGSAGYDSAADYVATKFTELGLEPAGDDGDFFQTVPLLRAEVNEEDTSLAIVLPRKRIEFEPGTDFVIPGDLQREAAELRAPLAYAGFGLVVPDLDYDAYEQLDVRDHIVVVHGGAPAYFPNDVRAHYSTWREKARFAVERGAVGLIVVHSEEDERRHPWDRVVRQNRTGTMRWLREDGRPADTHPELFLEARLSGAGFQKLFEASAHEADGITRRVADGRPPSLYLGQELQVRTATRHEMLRGTNVVARLEGSDPALAGEHVVVTAHLDHLGAEEAGETEEADLIYNGAYDNASGVAVMLEVARALASLDRRPSRSVLFVAVTGEEKGLLGSDYFVRHLPLPLDRVVANVNLDMVLMLHPLADVIGYGAEHSTLAAPLERAAAQLGVALTPDPFPESVVFVRSDQYSFVRRGVPALFVVPGFRGSRESGRDVRRWIQEVYHSPADDMSQAFDLDAGAAFTRLQTLLLWHVAEAPDRPAWRPGDFFAVPRTD